jgi:hypothetical protein
MSNVGAGGSGPWFGVVRGGSGNRTVIPLCLRWLQPLYEDEGRMDVGRELCRADDCASAEYRRGARESAAGERGGEGLGLSSTAASNARFSLARVPVEDFLRATPSINLRGPSVTTLPTLRRVSTRVGAIALADEGAGTSVVLWPSLFSDHRLYAPLLPLLGDRWRTIRIDGASSGIGEALAVAIAA